MADSPRHNLGGHEAGLDQADTTPRARFRITDGDIQDVLDILAKLDEPLSGSKTDQDVVKLGTINYADVAGDHAIDSKTAGYGEAVVKPPSKDVIAAAVEKRMTIEKAEQLRIARTDQLAALLQLVHYNLPVQPEYIPVLLRDAQTRAPLYSADEIQAIIDQYDLVANHEQLQKALITGGRKKMDHTGRPMTVFSMAYIAQGGFGKVTDAYALKEGKFVPAVVKESLLYDKIEDSDPEAEQKRLYNSNAKDMFAMEMMNAIECTKRTIPGLTKVLLIAPASNDQEQSMIVYEKITYRDGTTKNFEALAKDWTMPASQKFWALAHGIDRIDFMHQANVVHVDLKPANLMVNENGEPVVIDIGSLVLKDDEIVVDPDDDPKPYGSIKKVFKHKGESVTKYVGYTPHFLKLDKLKQALAQGKGIEVADRMALGGTIRNMLESNYFLPSTMGGITQTFKDWLNLPDYPPQAIKDMIALAEELEDIATDKPLRPLPEIANDVRTIARRFQIEVDPIQDQMCRQRGQIFQQAL